MDITKLITPQALAEVWNEAASNRIPYAGESLFPAKKQAGLDLSWIKGSRGLPVSLMPSAFDAKATFRDRIGLEKLQTEMPFFREGFKVKEKNRQDILRAQQANDPYLNAAIARIYDDSNDLIEGANVVPERMRMQLLFAPGGDVGITIKANGVDYTYDYDPPVGGTRPWKSTNYFALSGNAQWNAPTTADPFTDIKNAKDAIRNKTGEEIAYLMMNSTTFNYLTKMDAVKKRFLAANGLSLAYLSDADVRRAIEDYAEVRFIIYDKQYKNENKVAAKFVPDNYVAFLPNGALGSTVYGTTPEEADLLGSNAAEVAIVNTGVAITQIVDPHPVNVNTFASEIVLPSYERMDSVALMKVVA